MEHINEAFLESYKRLDKLCREIYRSDKGVTSYIDDMMRASTYEIKYIPNWETDLNCLKKLRSIRNQLTHDVGTLYTPMCTQNDVVWLEDFYNRILHTSDPIAMLAKQKSTQPQPSGVRSYQQNVTHIPSDPPKDSSERLTAFLGILCIFLTLVLALLIYFLF